MFSSEALRVGVKEMNGWLLQDWDGQGNTATGKAVQEIWLLLNTCHTQNTSENPSAVHHASSYTRQRQDMVPLSSALAF